MGFLSFFSIIIFSVQSAKKRKKRKEENQRLLEKERIKGVSGEAGVRFFTTRADSRRREREREKERERLEEWEWVSERDRASGRWEGESQRDRYINIYTHTQKTKGGENRATNTHTFMLSRVAQHVASKSRTRIGNKIEERGEGYTREG